MPHENKQRDLFAGRGFPIGEIHVDVVSVEFSVSGVVLGCRASGCLARPAPVRRAARRGPAGRAES